MRIRDLLIPNPIKIISAIAARNADVERRELGMALSEALLNQVEQGNFSFYVPPNSYQTYIHQFPEPEDGEIVTQPVSQQPQLIYQPMPMYGQPVQPAMLPPQPPAQPQQRPLPPSISDKLAKGRQGRNEGKQDRSKGKKSR